MANPMNQKKLAVLDSRKVGEITQAVSAPNDKWLAMNGYDYLCSTYPELRNIYPFGIFTGTARTFAATPGSDGVVSDGTNYFCSGATGTDALQASADGITWVTTTGGWAASSNFPSKIVAGSRYIIAPSAGESQAYVITTGGTAANLVVKANWTATTGGTTTALVQGLAYSPTLGISILTPSAAGAAVYTLPDGGTAWTSRAVTSATKKCACWTGERFIVATTTQLIHTSTNGTSWSDAYLPIEDIGGASQQKTIASDGRGTVVYVDINATSAISTLNFLVSKDHGVSWGKIPFPQEMLLSPATAYNAVYYVWFVNGRFFAFAQGSSHMAMSDDGHTWSVEPIKYRGADAVCNSVAYKSGVYAFMRGGVGTGQTAIEDMSKVRLPALHSTLQYTTSMPGVILPMYYIKARSE